VRRGRRMGRRLPPAPREACPVVRTFGADVRLPSCPPARLGGRRQASVGRAFASPAVATPRSRLRGCESAPPVPHPRQLAWRRPRLGEFGSAEQPQRLRGEHRPHLINRAFLSEIGPRSECRLGGYRSRTICSVL